MCPRLLPADLLLTLGPSPSPKSYLTPLRFSFPLPHACPLCPSGRSLTTIPLNHPVFCLAPVLPFFFPFLNFPRFRFWLLSSPRIASVHCNSLVPVVPLLRSSYVRCSLFTFQDSPLHPTCPFDQRINQYSLSNLLHPPTRIHGVPWSDSNPPMEIDPCLNVCLWSGRLDPVS